ncbi:hypothetical protein [Exiguobacterium profundum]|uniref:hypothetical protein n=1 Tax=Exiguobacterium profundum TaxID=307643 RepID=UPI002AA88954|nr:hypothetical protein [Exiguobacterium profundum]
MRKIIYTTLTISVIIIIGGWFFYIDSKKEQLEGMVYEHLVEDKQVPKNEIMSVTAFNANLPKDKNYLVSVKLMNDPNTYYYYRVSNGSIALESYTDENREEHVSP